MQDYTIRRVVTENQSGIGNVYWLLFEGDRTIGPALVLWDGALDNLLDQIERQRPRTPAAGPQLPLLGSAR